ncbi:hypothetical protein AaE_008951 [Aphanomyces astaci]|uniref:Uncharacterized protein n=1 Tax=Aphanomyces astaci TaxID=112090 RepID=A0A6A5ADR0_APHAT|nr:hypothetical protein AaE_008951 [Aphanomyces astaci]
MAGSMALKFNVVINDSKSLAFVQKAEVFLEEAIIDNLNDFSSAEPAKWKKTQDSWFCCGYFDIPSVQNHIGLKYINMAKKINGIQGIYCSSNCTVTTSNTTQIITSTTSNTSPSQLVCPQVGASWCRDVFLDNAETNNVYVGWVAIVGGSSQLLGFLLGMFLLLCDVRMMRLATMQPNVMEQAIKNAQT